ncbi:glycosyltransferase [Chitinophaga sp. 30R24]|uniref:glycosyltransferase n=1 Tax=Chitinophaga sp. 30R24 TaxID=3248838 RepID=UPI003B8EFE8E
MKTKSIRILELNFERTWRGGERQTLYNTQGFIAAGMKVDVLCRKNFPIEQKLKEQGFSTIAFKNVFGVIFFLITRGHKYDIFHVQTSHILTYAILTRPFHWAKVVFTRRIDFVPKGKLTLLKYRLCTHVVGISRAIQQIMTDFGVKDVQLISSAIAPKVLDTARARRVIDEMNLPPYTKVIATTAAFVAHKDPLCMVAAIKHLTTLRNDFVFLHFGNGEMQAEVRAAMEEAGLLGIYRIMGFQHNVEDFFSVMDAFAMSSSEEGLGSSVLDAFIYRVPVAATNAGGLKDLLEEGRGLMCAVKDSKTLALQLDILLSHPQETAQMVERAYKFAITKHNITFITQQYLQLLGLKGKQHYQVVKPATVRVATS